MYVFGDWIEGNVGNLSFGDCEGTIRDLKKGAGRKMVQARTSKRIWDNTMEF